MPETKTIMTNTAFDAAEQIAIEQTARNAEANMENYAASAIAQVANAASAAISHIDQYAPMVICTEGEYPAQPVAGTMYFRFPNE